MGNELTEVQEKLLEQCSNFLLSDEFEKGDLETVEKLLKVEGGFNEKRAKFLLRKKVQEILLEQSKELLQLLETPKVIKKKKDVEKVDDEVKETENSFGFNKEL